MRCDVGLVISSDSHQTFFQLAEHGSGNDKEGSFRYMVEVSEVLYCAEPFLVYSQERHPGHIGGDGRGEYDDIPCPPELEQVFRPVIDGGGLA